MRETVLPRPKGTGFQKKWFLNYAFLAQENCQTISFLCRNKIAVLFLACKNFTLNLCDSKVTNRVTRGEVLHR